MLDKITKSNKAMGIVSIVTLALVVFMCYKSYYEPNHKKDSEE